MSGFDQISSRFGDVLSTSGTTSSPRNVARRRHAVTNILEIYMSDQIIVATFDTTNAAYDAATALKALKDKGVTDFKPKAGVMVKKDDKGNVSLLESKERPLWGTGIGTASGALIGLIGGAPGAAIGAAIGAM